MFRTLNADEIECRVAQIKDDGSGLSLLLYKDARCDMNILDETVGATNWRREHSRENANCIVSIWDESKNQWIGKEDTGTESNTQKEKGLASDSFKRACVNWGIGRELYTSPFIWISNPDIGTNTKGKLYSKDNFHVDEIGYDEKHNINKLVIKNQKGAVVFDMGKKVYTPKTESRKGKGKETDKITDKQVMELLSMNTHMDKLAETYKVGHYTELTKEQAQDAINKKKRAMEKDTKNPDVQEAV